MSSSRRLALALLAVLPIAACSDDDDVTRLTIRHGEVPAPTLIDAGDPGDSAGDMRIFHFPGETEAGEPVLLDWVMTTTSTDSVKDDVESRVTTGIVTLGGGLGDQILLEGVALYPAAGATLDVADTVVRAIVGGTGRYADARGDVTSTRAEDGTWEHVFRIVD